MNKIKENMLLKKKIIEKNTHKKLWIDKKWIYSIKKTENI